ANKDRLPRQLSHRREKARRRESAALAIGHCHVVRPVAPCALKKDLMQDIIHRYAKNPILTPDMIPGANAIFNSSVVPFNDRFVGVFRIELRKGFQTLRVGWSKDGINDWKFDPEEVLVPTEEPFTKYEEARYDPRITKIDDAWYICHASESRFGCQISV